MVGWGYVSYWTIDTTDFGCGARIGIGGYDRWWTWLLKPTKNMKLVKLKKLNSVKSQELIRV